MMMMMVDDGVYVSSPSFPSFPPLNLQVIPPAYLAYLCSVVDSTWPPSIGRLLLLFK